MFSINKTELIKHLKEHYKQHLKRLNPDKSDANN